MNPAAMTALVKNPQTMTPEEWLRPLAFASEYQGPPTQMPRPLPPDPGCGCGGCYTPGQLLDGS